MLDVLLKKNTNHKIDLYLLLNFWDGPSQGDSTQPPPPPPPPPPHTHKIAI